MAERELPIREMYPNNSNAAKERAAAEEARPKVKKVVTRAVNKRKKPIARRFAEAFGAKEGQGVIEYIICDIIVPATKNMLLDSISDGVEMALFGDVSSRRRRPSYDRRASGSRYEYDRVSWRDGQRRDDDRRKDRERSERNRVSSIQDYEYIEFTYKEDAENVINGLIDIIDSYGDTTVSDLYELSGYTAEPQMRNYGWTALGSASVKRIRNAYVLDLPRPVLL